MGRVGSAVGAVAAWWWELLSGIVTWAVSVVAYLPRRAVRTERAVLGVGRPFKLIGKSARNAAVGLGRALAGLFATLFDLVGGPEMLQLVNRAITKNSPLTDDEIAAASSVLGRDAVRWKSVRVAEGGLIGPIFRLNNRRAFTAFHTINLPAAGHHVRSNRAILVHELVHVLQFERLGSIYIGQALHAQATTGYDYGGSTGLQEHCGEGGRFRDFNREQQAQLVQHYFERRSRGVDVSPYEPYIEDVRTGLI